MISVSPPLPLRVHLNASTVAHKSIGSVYHSEFFMIVGNSDQNQSETGQVLTYNIVALFKSHVAIFFMAPAVCTVRVGRGQWLLLELTDASLSLLPGWDCYVQLR